MREPQRFNATLPATRMQAVIAPKQYQAAIAVQKFVAEAAEGLPIPGPIGPEGPQGPPGDPATQTPWAQDIDAAVYDLNSMGVIRFQDHTGVPGPITVVGNKGGTLHLLSDNGGSINIESIGTGRVMMSTESTGGW